MDLARRWVASDHHFFHENILSFIGENGELIRPGFSSVEEMNEFMIEQHNARVKSDHSAWFLGDVVCGAENYAKKLGLSKKEVWSNVIGPTLQRLNGDLRLNPGNHDVFLKPEMLKRFSRMQIGKRYDLTDRITIFLSHYPARKESFTKPSRPRVYVNVHGHIHERVIDDPFYINVGMECTGFSPVNFEEIVQIIKDRGLLS